ncbi:hypothetical protein NDU88_010394 [Pleurodeles waltl]|uniref:Uncharacterized protein n=1 Tax=Pleurodeles waltl TaxID=8319 RepID=A0AAV7PYP9_PLEWA|nr:hypothetical protein NDU88_010394 [Pleurodeles waltl]
MSKGARRFLTVLERLEDLLPITYDVIKNIEGAWRFLTVLECLEDLLPITYDVNKNIEVKNSLLLTSYWRRASCSSERCEPTCMLIPVVQFCSFVHLHRELRQSGRVTGELCSFTASGVKFCNKLVSTRASRPAVSTTGITR